MSHYEIADPLRNTLWDALVVAHPQASFFHSTAWARVLMASYGFEPFYISSLSGGRLTECLALMEAKSRWFGVRGVSLPFTDICPVLGTELRSGEQLIQEGLRLGVVRHWKYLELRVGRRPHGLEAAIPSQKYYGHEVDLSTTEEMVFRRFDAPVQRAIRKAQRSGVSCEISRDMEAMKHFYSLHSKTRQKHGLPPQPFSFFRQIQANIIAANQGFVVLAKHQSRSIAGAVIFLFGSRAIYKFAASDPAFLQLRGNNLVLWTVIQNLKAQGFDQLHLGRTSLHDEGLRRFKTGWGAHEEMLHYYKYDLAKNQFVPDLDRSRGWYNALFSVLPLPWLRWLGACLYRHLT